METGNVVVDAQGAFARERRRRRLERATRWLRRQPGEHGRLVSLEQALGGAPPANRGVARLRAIPLDSIVGTAEVGKGEAFDRRFRPPTTSRERWERLWAAGRGGAPLPPISVYRLGDQHFVSDGHHRVSVANALGMAAIDAEVTELDRPRFELIADRSDQATGHRSDLAPGPGSDPSAGSHPELAAGHRSDPSAGSHPELAAGHRSESPAGSHPELAAA